MPRPSKHLREAVANMTAEQLEERARKSAEVEEWQANHSLVGNQPKAISYEEWEAQQKLDKK